MNAAFDLAVACILTERQADTDRAQGNLAQAEMLTRVSHDLRKRIVAELSSGDAAKVFDDWPIVQGSDGDPTEGWPKFVLEEIGGRSDYREWAAGRVPVLSEKFLRTSKHVMRLFKNWLVKKNKVGSNEDEH